MNKIRPHARQRALAVLLLLSPAGAMAASATISPPPADLAELSLEQLMEVRIERVFSASKYEQKVTRAPASVTIVTGDEIVRSGHRNLADVLRSVRGIYVMSDRNYANFGIRGFARPGDFNTRLLLLVDGHRMNDRLYSSALIGTESMIDVALIERVEVIRGPSSSIYGNSAFFGVINVVTRKGAQIDGLETTGEVGDLGTRSGSFLYGKLFQNNLEIVFGGSLFETSGQTHLYYPEFDTPASNHGVAVNADDEHAKKLFGRVSYHDLTLSAGYSEREKHVPTASFGTYFNDGRERTTDESIFADAKFEHAFERDLLLTARAYYDRYAYRAAYPYNWAAPTAKPFVVVSHDDNYGEGVGADLQFTKEINDVHTVVFGAEYRRDLHLLQSNYNDDPKTYNFYSDRTNDSGGIFAQGEFALRRDLLASTGVRYDYFRDFGGTVSPRLGLIYNPAPQSTVKLLYGSAYRAPNAYEAHLDSPGYVKSNPALQPEKVRTLETVFEQYFARGVRGSVSGYVYRARGLISQEFDPADGLSVFENAHDIEARGVEVELEGRYARDLLIRSSYTLQRTKDQATGAEIDNSPRHMAKLSALVPLYQTTTYAGLELQYLSGLTTLRGSRTDDFLLTNLTVTTRALSRHAELSVALYNLFDERYSYPGSTGHVQETIPQDGRTLRVKITCRF